MSTEDAPTTPTLRVVRGAPDAEELAALTALLAAGSGGEDDGPDARALRGGWNDPSRQHRRPLLPGPNAWRASAW